MITFRDVTRVVRKQNSKGEWHWTCYTSDHTFYRMWDKDRGKYLYGQPYPVRLWFR